MGKSKRIEWQSLNKQALNIIKTRILSGQKPPGSRFLLDKLANEFGISRTPIREALSKLVSMGLISYDGNSYMVASYSAKDVKELFAIRRALEVLAIREATKYLTKTELDRFRLLCKKSSNSIKESGMNMELMINLDTAFHKLVIEGSRNTRLKSILSDIEDKIWLIHKWGHLMKNVEYVENATIEEYVLFLKYLESGDIEKVSLLMEEHLTKGEQYTLECLGFLSPDDLQYANQPTLNHMKEKES